ncbi:MAG: hypothetical protein A4E57_04303 [Syntrophorhabdaceae bacterium PtaU1.Bin034]|jgi:hypothetical protein|nr:MAG: hypothetical protein A4E57_04303 [Syntrophorhabdaceae bacterium PtaU1.Bin034]
MDKKKLIWAISDNNREVVHGVLDAEAERLGHTHAKEGMKKGACTSYNENLEDLLHVLLRSLTPLEYDLAIKWIHRRMDLSILCLRIEEGRALR